LSRLATLVPPRRRWGHAAAVLAGVLTLGLAACETPKLPPPPPTAQAAPPAPAKPPMPAVPVPPVTVQPVTPQPAPGTVTPVPPGAPPPAAAPPGNLGAAPPSTNAGGKPQVKVAILLPLSGPNAAIGHALLNAAQMALYDIGDDSFVLLPRDTEETPDGAAGAARNALEAGARLILGPLFSASISPVATLAQAAGVNVVAFSNDARAGGPGVYIMGFLPGTQVERVVSFAHGKGLTRFAALLPDNAYGQTVGDQLHQSVQAAGDQIVDVETYDAVGKDATNAVRQLAHYDAHHAAIDAQIKLLKDKKDAASKQTLQKLEADEAAAPLPFDAVMLPDGGERLLAIAPLLPYYDVDTSRVKLLGSGQWDDPRLGKEPALVGGWYAAADPQTRADFEQRYATLYGAKPPLVATIAYDATALAATLARAPNGADFGSQALTNPNGFSGLTGIFRFRGDGLVERNLAILEVTSDGAKVIDPAPASFQTAAAPPALTN
jgi:branched-chain amino acid transport system substrate-binding protein